MIEQESYDEDLKKKAKRSRAARRILDDPDIIDLLDEMVNSCYVAFENLSLGESLQAYMTIQHELRAIKQFREKLEGYIFEYEAMEQQREQDERMEEINI